MTLINRKTEELVESIYKQLKPNEAVAEIEIADKIMTGSKFYSRIFRLYEIKNFTLSIDKISKIDPHKFTWYEYLVTTTDFEIVENEQLSQNISQKYKNVSLWLKLATQSRYWQALQTGKEYPPEINEVINLYELLKKLNQAERKKALEITTANIV